MAVYEYQAIGRNGKSVRGVIDADSPASARRKLREQQLWPTDLSESAEKMRRAAGPASRGGGGRISLRDVSLMTRQLAVLLEAGMPLVEALSALIEQTVNARLRKIVYEVRDKVNEGSTLADALAQHPRVFNELHVNMVSAGETSGALEQVLFRLADMQERQARVRSRVLFSLSYPAIMMIISMGIITFLMLVIVPKIQSLFESQDRALPFITKMFIGAAHVIGSWWGVVILAGLVLLVVAWRLWVRRPEGRLQWDRLKLRLPLFGQLHLKLICSRFSRTLGTMLDSGLTMMKALDVVKSVVQNRQVEHMMDDVKAAVRRGQDLSIPLREAGIFPPLLVQMAELGQRSGQIEKMMLKIADNYEEDVEMTVEAMVRLLEPLMIVFMGGFVGFLVIAMLLPVFSLTSGL